jgi:hypothetical protein
LRHYFLFHSFLFDAPTAADDEELVTPMFELCRSAVVPPLPPSLVFLYLLEPDFYFFLGIY